MKTKKSKGSRPTSLAGTVAERIAIFRPDMRALLWSLHALVKDGAWTAEMIVDADLFAGSLFDKRRRSRALRIRRVQALVDIVTLPEAPNPSREDEP